MNGKESFMSHKILKEILVNDKVVFCAEITNVKPNFPVKVPRRTMGTAEHLKLIEVPQNKSRVTWKITQFSSFDGDHHSSHEFTVGPRKWYAKIIYVLSPFWLIICFGECARLIFYVKWLNDPYMKGRRGANLENELFHWNNKTMLKYLIS